MSKIVLKNISKVYPSRDKRYRDGVKAVENFSMEINDNEFIVFVGPSGCGKSTTLRMIAGLEDITSGELYIDDQYMNDVEPKNRDIAMVFQNYALYPHMNAYKNIAFGLTIRKIKEYKYIKNDETKKVLEEIKQITRQNEIIRRSNLKNQKILDKLLLKKYADEKFIEDIEFHLTNDPTLDVSKPSVQKKMIKLNEQKKSIQDRLTETKQKLELIEEKINSKRAEIDNNFEKIKKNKAGIKKFKEYKVSTKLIKKYEKSLKYYLKVQSKDSLVFKEIIESLHNIEKEIVQCLNDKKNSSNDDENKLFKLELKLRGLNNRKNLILENMETLNYRKNSLEDSISNVTKKLEYYKNTPQPLFYYRHYTKSEINKKVKKAADILEINQILGRKPKEMSGGQRQRIALGRAIVREPKVFLLDEPLSNLDAKLRAAMRVEISKLHESLKTTFIYVTHDQVEAMTMGTRIVVMKDGVVQQIDTPTGLFDYPINVFVAGFIGTPQMNFFEATLKKNKNSLEVLYKSGVKQEYDLKKVREIRNEYLDGEQHEIIVGVRGESIYLNEDGIESKIDAIEVLGNETNVYLTLNNNQDKKISLIVKGRPDLRVGDSIKVSFKDSDLYLFDKYSEQSIIMKK